MPEKSYLTPEQWAWNKLNRKLLAKERRKNADRNKEQIHEQGFVMWKV